MDNPYLLTFATLILSKTFLNLFSCISALHDHKSENVQKIIKAYLKFLKEDMGYTGFRYDMVKVTKMVALP